MGTERIFQGLIVTDIVDKSTRSRYMAAVKSKGNLSTEIKIAHLLRSEMFRGWRRHLRNIPGTPDFSWPSEKVALFVDGCFWHGCPKCYKAPETNQIFWSEKILSNKKRDRRVNRILRHSGWKVARVWECRIRDQKFLLGRLKAMMASK